MHTEYLRELCGTELKTKAKLIIKGPSASEIP